MEKYTDLSTKLGRGSFGSVRLIQRNADMKLLAMKEIELATEDAAKNAYNESHFLERLQHPNIVKFYETFVQKECLYLIMEYCEQGDLQKKIKEATASEEYFSEQQVLEWFTQVCMAVKQLHDNHVIHRDIKVHNTFLNSEGMVKLGDFGISKQLDHTADLGKTWLGTPFYVSPEMLSHSISSYKSDIWMLGCLLHELCTLEKPFFGDNIPTVINKILYDNYSPVPEHYSSFVHTLIASLLDKNAEKRPSIDTILEIPEIQEEVEKLRLKYPEVYTTKSSSLVTRGHAEQAINRPSPNLVAKRWTSATIVQKVEEKVTKEIENSKDGNLNSTWDLYDQSQSMTPQSKSTNSKQGAHNGAMNSQETLKSAVPDQKRKPNSIRALVEQKKAILSPSNCEKLSHINSSAMAGQVTNQSFSSYLDNNNNQKPQGPCQEQVHNITVHSLKLSNIHIDEHEPARDDKKAPFMKLNSLDKINKQSSEEYGLIDKYQEAREAAKESPCPIKTMEGSTKKHHNLSINIPTSSEHGGDSPAQVKTEKALPAKMRTAMNEMGDPNVVPTTKVGAKKSFAFSNYLFDQKLPTSPNRTFWVSQFLKQKLGDEKFEKVKELIDHSPNPTQLLKDESEKVMEIIGEDKRDCLVMLSFLVSHSTNSVTPTGENKVRTSRPSQMDGRNIKCFKSPASANPFLRNIFPASNDPGSADRVNSQSKI